MSNDLSALLKNITLIRSSHLLSCNLKNSVYIINQLKFSVYEKIIYVCCYRGFGYRNGDG